MKPSHRNALLCALVAVLSSHGAIAAATVTPAPPLDEVTIKGKRSQLEDTRRQFNKVQDRLFARYNQLNRNPDFDVNCSPDMPTGTRIGGKKACKAVYEERALQMEGQAFFERMQPMQDQAAKGNSNPTALNSVPAMSSQIIEARRPEFRENMRKIASGDKELRELLRERSELIERYQNLRREIFGLPALPPRTDATATPTR